MTEAGDAGGHDVLRLERTFDAPPQAVFDAWTSPEVLRLWRTTVVLTNRGLGDDEARRLHREGWQASFDNLVRVLAHEREPR